SPRVPRLDPPQPWWAVILHVSAWFGRDERPPNLGCQPDSLGPQIALTCEPGGSPSEPRAHASWSPRGVRSLQPREPLPVQTFTVGPALTLLTPSTASRITRMEGLRGLVNLENLDRFC